MTHDPLDAFAATLKTGREPFTHQGKNIGASLSRFWSWACSDLLSNAMRGVLAEYIVGLALETVDGGTRIEWDAADLITRQGLRVEVKSSAFVQSWKQQRLSTITFTIKPTHGLDAATNAYNAERKRHADVYVFCVFMHEVKETADPLNLNQWEFYVVSTTRLNAEVGDQKTIGLKRLQRIQPEPCSFDKLADRIDQAIHS